MYPGVTIKTCFKCESGSFVTKVRHALEAFKQVSYN